MFYMIRWILVKDASCYIKSATRKNFVLRKGDEDMLTPLDIETKRFSKQMMNGYSVDEVDDFLDQLTLDYQSLYKETTVLKEKISDLEASIEHYKTIEGTLQNTLVMAQTTAEDIKKMANQQADQIVKEAELHAKESVNEIKNQTLNEIRRMEDVKKQFEVYKAKMEALLISQLELLKDDISED